MLILGMVRSFQPVHGYDVRRVLLSWHADEWANVAPGSVYHGLKKLAEEGLLREVATEQVAGRPARTTYEITAAGEAEFQDLLRRYCWEYREPTDPFTAAYMFLPALPGAEGVAALRNRARMLRLVADRGDMRVDVLREVKPHVLEMFQLAGERARLEADWCEKVAGRLAAGDLLLPDWTGRAQPEPVFGGGEHGPVGSRRAQPEPVFGGGEHGPVGSRRAQPEPGLGGGEHGGEHESVSRHNT
jgi:DNA-binding PadR family transcriptional regulator